MIDQIISWQEEYDPIADAWRKLGRSEEFIAERRLRFIETCCQAYSRSQMGLNSPVAPSSLEVSGNDTQRKERRYLQI